MKFFIGSKIVLAIAMTRAAFVAYRYPDQPPNPDAGSPDDAGYLVEYTDGGAPNHPGHAGYISWCPKDQFESQNLLIGDVGHLPPHQQRVIAEREQLADRIQKLEAFLHTDLYASLPDDEQQLLKMRADAMVLYLGIINTRTSKFA
ncbi:crAss001_48 related protein [Pseudomonas gingeri]|uniref:crAss001_48 related protein n=1 Tax=Pseudomonas gingeri TaxID=117681 RepID=UPI00159FEA1A|nr:hypothetical protein [Pseudomonas gingeri]NWE46351.1 hypothetical protein [Pseudomonas gingeri]